ncbi:MAG: MMPL family transporter [Bacteroidota bacterium]
MKWIWTYNRWVLAFLLILSLLMAGGTSKLSVSHNVEDYFSPLGEDLKIYLKNKAEFGEDDQYLMVSMISDDGIYKRSFLSQIDSMKTRLKAVKGIQRVLWVDDWLPKRVRLRKSVTDPIIGRELFISKDHQAASILLFHDDLANKEAISQMVKDVEAALAPFPRDKIRINGKVYFTSFLENFILEDSGKLFLLTFGLVFFLLILMIGSIRLIILSLLVPILSICFTMGLMGHLGIYVNLFTALIPTLVLIISVSDIIHILKGSGPEDAEGRVRFHLAALLLTTLTTIIGFGSLLSTGIRTIMEFGGFVSVGVMFTFLLTTCLFSDRSLSYPGNRKRVDRWLGAFMDWIKGFYHKTWVQWAVLLFFAAFIALGIGNVKVNSFLIDGVPDHSLVKEEAVFFDQEFAGSRPLSILVQKPSDSPRPSDKQFFILDSLIRKFTGALFLIGPQDHFLDTIPQMQVEATDSNAYRYYGLMGDIGSYQASRKFDSLLSSVTSLPELHHLRINYTGVARMLDKTTMDTAWSIQLGLLIALGITFILLIVYFGSWQEAFISLIVNTIPLFTLASLYGILDIGLRPGTSVVFTVAFGIAIDDTMHMLARYKKAKLARDHFDAVIVEAGKPILMTSLVFGLSFSVLAFAGLESISVLGLSMVVGCFSAFMADIFLLPAFLKWLSPIQPSNS